MTTNTDLHVAMPELLPCPFCGARGSIFASSNHSRAWEGGCTDEDCAAFELIWEASQAEAVAAWNRRAAEGLPQAVLELNAAWNRKESEEAIAGHMDLCRRLALAAVPPKQQPTGVRCHNDACCGGQLPCPTRQACGLDPAPGAAPAPHHPV